MTDTTLTNPIISPVVFQPGTSDAEIEAAAAQAARKRRLTVFFWRYFILIVFLGGWELLSRTKLIDEFFFSKPSTILARLWE